MSASRHPRHCDLSKQFGATRALDHVDFSLDFGEIHALVGENGAGKSTLIRILGGVHRADSGTIEIAGEAASFRPPARRDRFRASSPSRRNCAWCRRFRLRRISRSAACR